MKSTSGEAYDINKRTIYIAPKSKIESRVHYAPEPTHGKQLENIMHPTPSTGQAEEQHNLQYAKLCVLSDVTSRYAINLSMQLT